MIVFSAHVSSGNMTVNDVVSVIVPVYNVEKTLDRCVSSIVAQTYPDLEIILVDDGSPDGCPRKCDDWAKKDPRIRVIHQENGGLSAARNTGLDIATGGYIAFVDSDDWVEPDYIEKLHAPLSKGRAALSICGIWREDENGNALPGNHELTDVESIHTGRETLRYLSGKTSADYVTVWNKMYRSSVWHNRRFRMGKLHEDEFITYQIIDLCSKIALVPGMLYHYVQTSGSIMHTKYTVRNLDRIEAWVERLSYYREKRYAELYAGTFALINWDIHNAVRELDWNAADVRHRLNGIFKQLRPFSMSVFMHLNGMRQRISYLGLCVSPFAYCKLRYGL